MKSYFSQWSYIHVKAYKTVTQFKMARVKAVCSFLFVECAGKLIWQFSSLNFFKLQIQDFIIEKIASLQVKSLPNLLQISSIIGSAIQETDTVSITSLVSKINGGYSRGCRVVKREDEQKRGFPLTGFS